MSISLQNTIDKLIHDMKSFKVKYPTLWNNPPSGYDYESLLEIELPNISFILENGDEHAAQELYETLPIAKHDSFNSFVFNIDIAASKVISGNNRRTKDTRAKRKKPTSCPHCGKSFIGEGLNKCECVKEDKYSTRLTTHSASDSGKHVRKQLETIIGTKQSPKAISDLIPHISTWLTNLRYIRDWLIYSDTMENWCRSYYMLTSIEIDKSFFDRIIPSEKEYAWPCNIFKLFVNPLFKMLEHAKRISELPVSNMLSYNEEKILEIIDKYIEVNGKRIPEETEEFYVNDIRYEIGTYISRLSLTPHVSPDHIKNIISNKFDKSIALPGLMFNFESIYTNKSSQPPRKHNFLPEYVHIVHDAFHVPYPVIDAIDKKVIEQIIIKFNEFYRLNRTDGVPGKGRNSPMFSCVLRLILDLAPYRKYRDSISCLIPVKDQQTYDRIQNIWIDFLYDKKQELIDLNVIGVTPTTPEIPSDISSISLNTIF